MSAATGRQKIDLVQRVPYLLELCRDRRVLHLGCTNWPYTAESLADGSLLHLRLLDVAAELCGVDNDRESLDLLAAQGIERLVEADLEKSPSADLGTDYDVIVAGEIIEHLSNPGVFLESVKRYMGPGTRLVLTTINAYCGMRFAIYALRGRGGVAEPVHPDHVAYYSYATLRLLVERQGLVVQRCSFYDLAPEHRRHNRASLNLINDVCVRVSPQLADGLVVECTLS